MSLQPIDASGTVFDNTTLLTAIASSGMQDWAHGYWIPDMGQQCYEGWHKELARLVGGPMMLVLGLLIPMLPSFLLWRRRGKLDQPDVQLQLGSLYQYYT